MKLTGENRIAMLTAKRVIANLQDIANPATDSIPGWKDEMIQENRIALQKLGHRLNFAMAIYAIPGIYVHEVDLQNGETQVYLSHKPTEF